MTGDTVSIMQRTDRSTFLCLPHKGRSETKRLQISRLIPRFQNAVTNYETPCTSRQATLNLVLSSRTQPIYCNVSGNKILVLGTLVFLPLSPFSAPNSFSSLRRGVASVVGAVLHPLPPIQMNKTHNFSSPL